jgi:hypothetical protein
MKVPELWIVHTFTLLIIILGILISIDLWKKYKERKTHGNFFIFMSILMVTVRYTLVFSLRFPTPEINLVKWTGIGIPFAMFLVHGFVPYFASLFALSFLKSKHRKIWSLLLTCLIGLYVIILSFYPPVCSEVKPGVWEWILEGLTAKYIYVYLVMAFVPVFLFLFYSVLTEKKIEKISGYFLFAGFFMVAYLAYASEQFGIFPPIGIRRVLITIALILVYFGFTMPVWLIKALKI